MELKRSLEPRCIHPASTYAQRSHSCIFRGCNTVSNRNCCIFAEICTISLNGFSEWGFTFVKFQWILLNLIWTVDQDNFQWIQFQLIFFSKIVETIFGGTVNFDASISLLCGSLWKTRGLQIFRIKFSDIYRNALFADRGVCIAQRSKPHFCVNCCIRVMRRLILLAGGIRKTVFSNSNNKQFIGITWNAYRRGGGKEGRWGYQGTIPSIYHLLKCLFIETVIFQSDFTFQTPAQVKIIHAKAITEAIFESQILDFWILESSSLLIWYSCIQFKCALCVPYWTGTIITTQRRPSSFATLKWLSWMLGENIRIPYSVQLGNKMWTFHRDIHYTNASMCCEGCTCRWNGVHALCVKNENRPYFSECVESEPKWRTGEMAGRSFKTTVPHYRTHHTEHNYFYDAFRRWQSFVSATRALYCVVAFNHDTFWIPNWICARTRYLL